MALYMQYDWQEREAGSVYSINLSKKRYSRQLSNVHSRALIMFQIQPRRFPRGEKVVGAASGPGFSGQGLSESSAD
jgi:hypothetical protein